MAQKHLICPQCQYLNEPNSKFCQECGAKLALAPSNMSDAGEIPATGITIEFPFSSSTNFEFAVEAAKREPTFVQMGEGKKALFRATYAQKDISRAVELINFLKGWRNRRAYIDGQKRPWDEVFEWVWCFQKRSAAYDPTRYCFLGGPEDLRRIHIFGCIHSQIELSQWMTWLHGVFDRDGAFLVDKNRLHHQISTALFSYRYCPALNESYVQKLFETFPERINPQRDKDWRYKSDWRILEETVFEQFVPEGQNAKVVVIRKYPEFSGTLVREELTITGVVPASDDSAKRIFAKLLERLKKNRPVALKI